MKRIGIVLSSAAVAASFCSMAPAGFNPGKVIGGLLKSVQQVDASITFSNRSNQTIVVVMDSDREDHTIEAGGSSVFHKANVGDAPTLSVRKSDGKTELYSRKVGPIGLKSELSWNGRKF